VAHAKIGKLTNERSSRAGAAGHMSIVDMHLITAPHYFKETTFLQVLVN
jgi:hypothetical protein